MKVYVWETHNVPFGERYNLVMYHAEHLNKVPLHIHKDFLELNLVVSGTAEHEINGVCYTEDAGWLSLLHPGDCHRMHSDDVKIITLNIQEEYLSFFDALWGVPNLCSRLANTTCVNRVKLEKDEFKYVLSILRKAVGNNRDLQARQQVGLFLAIALSRLLHKHSISSSRQMHNAPAWFEQLIEWCEHNAEKNLTIDELYRKACRCSAHISREFKKQMNCTPTDYLLRLRLSKAARLLLSSSLPISEIAQETGFQNLSHFCRRFKLRYNFSPREYRTLNTSIKE